MITPTPAPTLVEGFGRLVITDVAPVLGPGLFAKASLGEHLPIRATVFGEGSDAVTAAVVLTDPDGRAHRWAMTEVNPGLDRWEVEVECDRLGAWTFHVEAWHHLWQTWRRHALAKLAVEQDVALVCAEGRAILTRTLETCLTPTAVGEPPDGLEARAGLEAARDRLRPDRSIEDLLAVAEDPALVEVLSTWGPRDRLTVSAAHGVFCERERARFSAWYEIFPRSWGATRTEDGTWRSGTFATAVAALDEAVALGFDTVYLPPIHPIGRSHRKGRNNALTAAPGDPGSPWAIGASEGGHDTVHPDLGTLADFDAFVAAARERGLEIALDLALQASPDHPWLREHPEFFTRRVDGSIATAENPPKKYEDIHPLNFDTAPESLAAECLRVVRFWMARGVRAFRVDNPHTKRADFWAWLIARVRASDPDVIFLAEAFTRPPMMQWLGRIGFSQGYTYFTWRRTKPELESYLLELSTRTVDQFRPNLWPNTPDILNEQFHHADRCVFLTRAVLAATMSPSWGMYSGYEWCAATPVAPGSEEYLDSEKYEYRPPLTPATAGDHPTLRAEIAALNRARREHPALQHLRTVTVHGLLPRPGEEPGEDPALTDVVCFSRCHDDDRVVVVADVAPAPGRTLTVRPHLPPERIPTDGWFVDAVSGEHLRADAPIVLDAAHPARVLVERGPS